MKNSILRIATLIMILTSMITTMAAAATHPLDVPDYVSGPGTYGVSSEADSGLDATVTHEITNNGGSNIFTEGQIADLKFTITSVQGDKYGNANKDLFFVLREADETDRTTYFYYPSDVIDAPGEEPDIHGFHLNEGSSRDFTSSYTMPAVDLITDVVLNYEVYDFGMFSYEGGRTWQKEMIASGSVTFQVVPEPEEDPETPEEPEEPVTPVVPVVDPVYFDLTVTSTEGGSVEGEGSATYPSGKIVDLATPVAEEGYEFVGWTGPVLEGESVFMDADKTVTANFQAIEVLIDEEETPEATPDEEDTEILDEETPEGTPEDEIEDDMLPQTGGLPMAILALIGSGFVGTGAFIKKRR